MGYTEGRVDSCRNYAPLKGVSMYVGGVVGVAGPTAVVNACYNAAPVTNGRLGAGGIVGYNRGSVSLCQNDGDIKAAFVNDFVADGSQKIAGGIVGENYGAVASCVNNGTVSAYQQLGGIVGLQSNFYSTASLTGNVNNGLVTEFEQGMSRGGVAGEASGGMGKAENNYYDASVNVNGGAMNAATAGVSGLSSSKLTSGDALAGLDAKVFNFAKAAYPVLSLFKDEPAAKALRSIYVGFQDGDKRTNVVKNVAVSSADGLKWTLVGGPEFTLEGDTLVVAPPTEMKMANDTLTAQTAEGYSKVFYLTSIPQNLFAGKGTQDDPYLLQTAEDLQKLSSFIAASKMEYDGYFFKVTNDIDCRNDTLRPIAYGGVNFQGSLDGNGKTIKGYVFDNENWRVSENGGFFGSVGASGVIHDLTLAGKFHGYANVGGFTSKLYGTLRRCTFKGTVSAKNAGVGGFAYEAYPGSVIDQCVNEGTVFSASRGYVGGVVSQMDKNAVMTSCVNKGKVSAASLYLGGLAATCRGTIRDSHNESPLETTYGHFGGVVANVRDSAVIENCYNQADLTGAGNMGGVIGSGGDKFTGIIKNCYNSGKISGQGTIGGFAGDLGTGYTIEDCYNTGDVESSKSTDNGGFVGKIDADEDYPSLIVRCYNTGDVKAADNTTGGFAGTLYDESVTAEDCYNTGNVSVTSSEEALGIGGFAGDLSGKALRCWNAGNVEANGYGIGGMGGYSWGVADSCFNVGNITSVGTGSDSYGRAGGIWGYGKAQISNCYNMGTITGSAMIAGINGMCFSESKVENCYNAGLIVVTGDDKTAYANIANIYGEDLEESVVSNNYYDEEVNAGSASDKLSGAKGLTSAALFDADLGDAFTHTRAAYPTLTALAGNVWAEFAAASVAFTGEGDNRNHVTQQFYVAKFDNVEWTASDNLRLADDGTVETTATGKAWLKATAQAGDETLEKTIDLEVLQITDGIGTLTDGKTVAKRRFFELGGVEVKHPVSGTVYIITETYTDGTTHTAKALYKE